MTLQVNKSFEQELQNCVILKTVNKETVESVSMIVEGLEFENVLIRGLNRQKFLAIINMEDRLDNVDLSFLEIGFTEVTEVNRKT